MKPSSRPFAARATRCSRTYRTSSGRRLPRSSPPSSCYAKGSRQWGRNSNASSCSRWNAARFVSRSSSTTCWRASASRPGSWASVDKDARTLIGSLLAQRGQTLDVGIPEELPPIDGDSQRLTQVFVNLIANASKFAPESSVIRIGAEADGGHIRTWVEDEGPGLPAGDDAPLFERFRRGADIEPEPGGLGLGLWIVKSIVERHGGQISAARTPEGRTRFTVTLPAEVSE